MARNAALKYESATKNIFCAYHIASALRQTAAAIHSPTQTMLRLTRRVSRWRALKRIICRIRGGRCSRKASSA